VIEIQGLMKYYGERRAIGPLSFSIAKGEIVGLLGLNGAGKTTTLRILACDLLPSAGSVTIDGLDIARRSDEVRALVGYLPDSPPLYDEMTVHEYLVFAARLRNVPVSEVERRVNDVEGATAIGSVRDDVIATLSHGFRQRVGIAQAIVHGPQLLVLDEPISGLDPVQIVEMRELVRNLRKEHTVLISSHILSEISETCDRILVIRDGEIVASGTEAELSSRLLEGTHLTVTVRGAADKARAIVLSVPGVRRADAVPSPDTAQDVTSYELDAERDVREAVCRAVVGGGLGLLEMSRRERELESIFLRLTKTESATGEQAGAIKEAS
jgi:ABC-2 type transport system ATP-binding protein